MIKFNKNWGGTTKFCHKFKHGSFCRFFKKDLNQDLGGGTTDKSWAKYFWRTNLQKLIKAVLRIFKVRRKSDNISHLTLSWTTPTKPMITCYLQVMRVWGALRSSAYARWFDLRKLAFKENWYIKKLFEINFSKIYRVAQNSHRNFVRHE